jgi:transposase
MLNIASRRIFLARMPIDMRRGIDTLSSVITSEFQHDPYLGDVFVFLGRDRRRVKIIIWDHSGFWLAMKRLERGTFAPPSAPVVDTAGKPIQQISGAELQMILEGIVVHRATYHSHYRRASMPELHNVALTNTRGDAMFSA